MPSLPSNTRAHATSVVVVRPPGAPPPALVPATALTPATGPSSLRAAPPSPKLLPTVRRALTLRHYSRRTEEAYVSWIRRYVRYHDLRHPNELGEAEIERFLSDLAELGRVSASTQPARTLRAGFIAREDAKRLAKKLDRGELFRVLSIWETTEADRRTGVRLLLMDKKAKCRAP